MATTLHLNQFLPWVSRAVALFIVIMLVGLMPDIAGIDPAQSIMRARAGAEQLLTAEALAAVREQLQLDDNALRRLWHWFVRVCHGDFGTSWISGASVLQSVQQTAKTSVVLMLSSLILPTLLFPF